MKCTSLVNVLCASCMANLKILLIFTIGFRNISKNVQISRKFHAKWTFSNRSGITLAVCRGPFGTPRRSPAVCFLRFTVRAFDSSFFKGEACRVRNRQNCGHVFCFAIVLLCTGLLYYTAPVQPTTDNHAPASPDPPSQPPPPTPGSMLLIKSRAQLLSATLSRG